MRQVFVTILVLVTVALSSSNVLPMSIDHLSRDLDGLESQHNDNIFSNRHQTKNVLDDLFKIYIGPKVSPESNKLRLKYDVNNRDDILRLISKFFNYNGEDFRKEQWHNYPRQLDRLHQFDEYSLAKKNLDPDPNDARYTIEVVPNMENIDETSNEFHLDSNTPANNIYDAVLSATNPLLILKIRLASLNRDFNKANIENFNNQLRSEEREDENNEQYNEENPEVKVIKVKREGEPSTHENIVIENSPPATKAVNKRIFSLWSRLQSLNHKGHELQHRRHLHAFYGLPDSDGGGILTAETRATLMRPPGSPLRWG